MKSIPKYTDNDIDEDMKLNNSDYMKILHHYQGDHATRKNKKSIKQRAHLILAQKLCRCIKSSNNNNNNNDDSKRGDDEGRRIGFCTRSIFNTKGLRQHGFRCKTKNGKIRPMMTRDITKTVKRLKIT
jgi:hypothetical protein